MAPLQSTVEAFIDPTNHAEYNKCIKIPSNYHCLSLILFPARIHFNQMALLSDNAFTINLS